ncbi:uncharacterized protein LOC142901449 [Nelusetta ayraudi]|uniref:uncharacterized protein LOC142901449 n=1 Tax=Nelusetta ayraudi TaxID=303726 RepID=UPI003F728F5F
MAESLLKSKLKRRKLSAEGKQLKIASSGTQNRSHSALFCSRESAQPRRCVSPAVAEWWSREQLTSVETLWALTLQSALPHQEEQQWQLVPQLPPCSSASRRPPRLAPDELRWCDLSEEVAPFPEPVPALLRTSSGPNPSSSSSSLEPALSAQTPPETAAPSDARAHQEEETTAPGRLLEGPQPFLPDRGRQPTSASCTAANSQGSAEDAAQSEEVVVKAGGPVGREVCRDGAAAGGRAGGGGGLQSCPMCLLEFPAGFSQMECDGHLAQCLSEVNVDVTW